MTGDQARHLVDLISMTLLLGVPVWTSIRLPRPGIFIAATYSWGLLLVSLPVIHLHEGGFWAVGWFLTLILGWPFALAYAAIIYGISMLVLTAIRKTEESVSTTEEQPQPSWIKQFGRWWRQLYSLERIGIMLSLLYPCALITIAFMA